jgi:23S rRNA (guanosine2251-2'-O)-methyltransferase
MRQHRNKRSDRGQAAGQSLVYGWHSALAALQNPRRQIRKVLATRNALARLAAYAARTARQISDG